MCSYDSYSSKSSSETSVFTDTDNVKPVDTIKQNEFGNFQETYDWIECDSIRFPGTTYFFNLRTQNSTWIRPVSRHVRLQHFTRKFKLYNNDCTTDPEISFVLSSESERENYDYNENEENEQNDKIYKNSEILARLYYGANIDQFSNTDRNDYFNDCFKHFVKNLCNEDRSNLDSSFHEITEEDETDFDKDAEADPSIIASNFLEVQLFTSEDVCAKGNTESISGDDATSFTEDFIIYSNSSSDEETKENCICKGYVKPHLSKMKSEYLLKEKFQNRKRKKATKKRAPLPEKKLPEMKIVREMYGTTTVSYDPVEPELPPGVKRTNLSDSSASEQETVRPVGSNDSRLLNAVSYAVNLSSRSSSSTNSSSSSSCTCSSSCSCSCSSSSSKSSLKSNASNFV